MVDDVSGLARCVNWNIPFVGGFMWTVVNQAKYGSNYLINKSYVVRNIYKRESRRLTIFRFSKLVGSWYCNT